MRLRAVGVLTSIILALVIFTVSIYRGVAPRYAYSSVMPTATPIAIESVNVEYELTYPGEVLPDSPLWFAKAARDKVMHTFTFNHSSRADLALTCADKRIQMAKTLFEKGKHDLGLSTLIKAEKYLAESVGHVAGVENPSQHAAFFEKIARASLKHREIIEEDILPLSPEDLKPEIVKTEDLSKDTYKLSRDILQNNGFTAPVNPFE